MKKWFVLNKANTSVITAEKRYNKKEDKWEYNDENILTWENEIEILDAIKESERIREKNFNNESIADDDVSIKKEKVKKKKKKRFFFF